MKAIWILIVSSFLFVSCSSIPDNPKLSFGKKCEVSEGGTVVTSHVWVYDGSMDLTATKESCNNIE